MTSDNARGIAARRAEITEAPYGCASVIALAIALWFGISLVVAWVMR